mmetsp:Transcript_172878/g.554292  ORF Transcript_172878/g.554292 Transcript_172878/m.554292 type:complete len:396 (-) Transcript_172878:189-1376(-)
MGAVIGGRKQQSSQSGGQMTSDGTPDLMEAAAKAKAHAAASVPFAASELDKAEASLRQLCHEVEEGASAIDWSAYRQLLKASAYLPHKDWARTADAATALAKIVGGPDDAAFRSIFERVLKDGGWNEAVAAAAASSAADASYKPWAVLVTGVNGIRKTSSIYQPWFKEVLGQALVDAGASNGSCGEVGDLPVGANSFFRQLDYIASTVACEELRSLYTIADVGDYAKFKDSIYTRYRTLSEMVGALLVEEAKTRKMNVMVETSGRDVAMFKYVDHFFDDASYRKLVVHFGVNDVSFAEKSVDTRMIGEQAAGRAALASGEPKALIAANAGGPYGSAVLRQVEAESNAVWAKVVDDAAFSRWHKARISIHGRDEGSWTESAHGDGKQEFEFGPARS